MYSVLNFNSFCPQVKLIDSGLEVGSAVSLTNLISALKENFSDDPKKCRDFSTLFKHIERIAGKYVLVRVLPVSAGFVAPSRATPLPWAGRSEFYVFKPYSSNCTGFIYSAFSSCQILQSLARDNE